MGRELVAESELAAIEKLVAAGRQVPGPLVLTLVDEIRRLRLSGPWVRDGSDPRTPRLVTADEEC